MAPREVAYAIPFGDGTRAVQFVRTGAPIIGQPQRYAVRDTQGGWICSRHKNWDLANARAEDCNRRAVLNGDCEEGTERYLVEKYDDNRLGK